MAGFLNSSQISSLTGLFQKHFDQFSSEIGNYITVIKEPIKVINNSNSLNMPGYSEDSLNENDITYTPVSATMPALIIYPRTVNSKPFSQLHFTLDENEIAVKVEASGAAFIDQGKTERVIVNSQSYNIQDSSYQQNFLGNRYYYYKLTITK